MTNRIYNFSAGPAVLPVEVLEEARDNLLSLGTTGIGILEHSHRGKAYMAMHEEVEALCRELAGIPDDFHVLFLQGGASLQFSMVPMNLLRPGTTADYLVTGAWSQKAVVEARRCGNVHLASSSEDRNFCYIPKTCTFSPQPAYVHFTSNNTIFGTQFAAEPEIPSGVPLVCDASSDVFSRPLLIGKYALIYAGSQKNLGPSGLTLVIIRDDLVKRGPKELATMLQYRTYADEHSLYNTPPTFAIYVMGLVLKWIKKQGGLAAIERINREKAGKLYRCLDGSRRFRATAEPGSRSLMNVTFVTGDAALDDKFIAAAKSAGLEGLKGHRSVGGMRASLYNAFPPAGVDALTDLIRDFDARES
ncbi:MAG TPA: 3-phosphoserine/phosphohydroxythreonine transaminase [Planctomycetaceae bacterium]|nr:3-phosphoserine/phosphohydroxythreonine transaminase [Planctomycetaceae bacterium]